jgi:hypothetical protein
MQLPEPSLATLFMILIVLALVFISFVLYHDYKHQR